MFKEDVSVGQSVNSTLSGLLIPMDKTDQNSKRCLQFPLKYVQDIIYPFFARHLESFIIY